MNSKETVQEVSLEVLWVLFWKKKGCLLLTLVLVFAGLFVAQKGFYRPLYTSTATVYILPEENSASEPFSQALKRMEDCRYLMTSRGVLETVIQQQELDWSAETLLRCVRVTNPEDTRILEISVCADTPEQARQLADCLCETGTRKIHELLGDGQVHLVETGNLPTEPDKDPSLQRSVLGAIGAGIVVYTLYLLRFLLQNKEKDS